MHAILDSSCSHLGSARATGRTSRACNLRFFQTGPPPRIRCIEKSVRLRVMQEEKSSALSDNEMSDIAKSILESDPAAAEKLKRIQDAAERVARAQAAMDEFQKMSVEAAAVAASEEKLKIQEANDYMAQAEVAAAQKLLQAAEMEMAVAVEMRSMAGRSAVKDAERVESVKAGVAAALGGLAAAVPLLLGSPLPVSSDLVVSLGSEAACCFLFGVVYRYVVRQALDDTHLKSGAVGAFAIVRGAGGAELLQAFGGEGRGLLDTLGPAALYTGQGFLVFGFAAAAVEAALKRGLVKPNVSDAE